jgi:hypothetical protein
MSSPDQPGDLVVSLQDRSRGVDPVSGHLVLGELVGASMAVFELPPDFEVGSDAQLEVLIAPATADLGAVVERIKPERLWISSLAPVARPQAAMAPLMQPSRYAKESTLDPTSISAALERAGDIWSALLELGLVSQRLLDVDPSTVLRKIGRIEEVHRRVQVVMALNKDHIRMTNCVFSSAC